MFRIIIIISIIAFLLTIYVKHLADEATTRYPEKAEENRQSARAISVFLWSAAIVFMFIGCIVYDNIQLEKKYYKERTTYSTQKKTSGSKSSSYTVTPKKETTTTTKKRSTGTIKHYEPDVSGYTHPDDFYYDHWDDFIDFEEAEDYYYEHGGF